MYQQVHAELQEQITCLGVKEGGGSGAVLNMTIMTGTTMA